MQTFLKVVRWIISIVLGLFLIIVFAGLMAASATSSVLKNPDNLKGWLAEGGVYQAVTPLAKELISKQIEQQSTADKVEKESQEKDMPFDPEQLQGVIGDVLEPSWLKSNVEQVIDAGYLWLEGETKVPEFEIDLNDRKEIFVESLAGQLKDRMMKLPECTDEELAGMSPEDFNPMEATCKPGDLNTEELDKLDEGIEQKVNEGFENMEMLEDGKIKSTLLIDISPDKTREIQQIYKQFSNILIYSVVVILVISLLIFLLVPKMATKLIFLGVIWLIPSLLIIINSFLSTASFYSGYNAALEGQVSSPEQRIIIEALTAPIRLAVQDIIAQMRLYGIVFLVLAVGLIVGGIIVKRSTA